VAIRKFMSVFFKNNPGCESPLLPPITTEPLVILSPPAGGRRISFSHSLMSRTYLDIPGSPIGFSCDRIGGSAGVPSTLHIEAKRRSRFAGTACLVPHAARRTPQTASHFLLQEIYYLCHYMRDLLLLLHF